jgi:RpiB/LacA/LacB family sugar-phosphate isomerase
MTDSDRIALDTPLAEFSSKPRIINRDSPPTLPSASRHLRPCLPRVGERVAAAKDSPGILACGTGIGVCIAANKVHGIRAALAHDSLTARRAPAHNHANVLALGGKVVGEDKAIAIVEEFCGAQFAGGRHQRRVDKISEMERVRKHQS